MEPINVEAGTSIATNSTSDQMSLSALSIDHLEEDDEDEDEDACDGTLSSFVRKFDPSPLLPDDYEEVSNTMHQMDLYNQIKHINDTLALGQRLMKYQDKLKDNKDIASAILYLSSILTDRVYAAKVSAECSADLLNVMNGMRNYELWAMKCRYCRTLKVFL